MIATVCSWIIACCILLCSIRLARGPKFSDRVVALDLAGVLTLALIILSVHVSEELVYLDVAVVLSLVAFLGTVIFARFLEQAPGDRRPTPKRKTK